MPERIQRKRTKGWRMPEGAIYVGRPTRWGNPWVVDEIRQTPILAYDPAYFAATFFRDAMDERLHDIAAGRDPYAHEVPGFYPTIEDIRAQLAGHDLACWCPPDAPCHADVLLELANAPEAAQ